MHAYDVSSLQRKSGLLDQHLKVVVEPLLFNCMMEIEKLQKSLRIAHANIKKLESKIPKQEDSENTENETLFELEDPNGINKQIPMNIHQQQQQQQHQQQQGFNPMLGNNNSNLQRNKNTISLNQNQIPNQGPSFLGNPLVQNAIANNPILSQQFQSSGQRVDPMEVIRKMKQSANMSSK